MKWSYSFVVWPNEAVKVSESLKSIFRMYGRLEMDFAEDEFKKFNHDLATEGFTLREVSRIPYVEPEIVLC